MFKTINIKNHLSLTTRLLILITLILPVTIIACSEDSTTAPGVTPDPITELTTSISNYTLTYSNAWVPVATSFPVDISPRWDSPPTPSSNVSYSIHPPLPNGANFDTNTGEVSGSINILAGISYIVTATGQRTYTGTATATFTITVVSPIGLSNVTLIYNDINAHVSNNVSSPPIWSNNLYPVTVTYAVTPALPLNLSLNTSNGLISGVPTNSLPITTYTTLLP